VKNAISIGEVFGKGKGWFSSASAQKTEEPTASQVVYAKLNEVMAKLDKEVQSLGLDQAKCDRINLIVLRLLLENPPDATQFLDKLTEKK
jgi:hypothetical protein